jgi:spore maturation protein CgeB
VAELKILMTNTVDDHLLAPQYFAGLQKASANVSGTYYMDQLNKRLASSLLAKVLYRLYPKPVYAPLNKILLQDVELFQPDLVWIFKGMEIWPETLDKIKSKGIKLVNYNLDHPFRYISKGSGNNNVLHSIPLFDLHMSYSQMILEELKNKYPGIKTFHLPFGFHDYVRDMKFQETEIPKVGFIGHADRHRAKALLMLAENGVPIDVFGPHWNRYFPRKSNHIQVYPAVVGNEYWSTLHRYRAQLNLFRDHNTGSHNMRSFEIPASGGIMLANYSTEQASYFKENEEAFYFRDDQALLERIHYILNMNWSQAEQIRKAARHRSMTSGYAYGERSQLVLNEFKHLVYG